MDSVSRGGSFFALVHYNGKIKRRAREGVKFKSECPTNVFITERTSFVDLQANIIRKLGLDARKRVRNIFYRVPIAAVQAYPEVRTTELYVEKDDVGASSGGSNPPPPPVHVRTTMLRSRASSGNEHHSHCLCVV
ncbi:hypothetical protein PIB30_088410 [Stylosanthes scabra]|uniref:Uncharacterized protein n=1 Tax=Stylosanthes scabra TaxID=79078 RepID=A0ABU6XSR7_9FABA|nr:hypothetical protein [Stylosanthes scabra]